MKKKTSYNQETIFASYTSDKRHIQNTLGTHLKTIPSKNWAGDQQNFLRGHRKAKKHMKRSQQGLEVGSEMLCDRRKHNHSESCLGKEGIIVFLCTGTSEVGILGPTQLCPDIITAPNDNSTVHEGRNNGFP